MDNSSPSGSERRNSAEDTRPRRRARESAGKHPVKDEAVRQPPRLSTNPYINFMLVIRKSKEMQGLSEVERVRKIGEMWSSMSDEERRPYYVMAERARRRQRRHGRGPQDVSKACARHRRSRSGRSSSSRGRRRRRRRSRRRRRRDE